MCAVPDALATLAAAVASYVAFALCALSQPAHWHAVAAGAPPCGIPVRRLRGLAALLSVVALLLSWHGHGPAFGTLLWVMLSAAMAAAVAFTLSGWPHVLAWLVPRVARSRRRASDGARATAD